MKGMRAPLERLCRGAALRLVLLSLCLAACASAAVAQQAAKSQSVLVPHAIILPSKVVAGGDATLAVLDAQGRLLPSATVELSGGEKVTTNRTGRALFRAPATPGMLVAKIPRQGISAFAPLLAPENSAPQTASESGPGRTFIQTYPRVLAVRDRFALEGTGFRGEADADRVFLADQLCFVLAASPTSLVVLPGPRVPIGDVSLRVLVDGRNAGQFQISAVLLDFAGPAETPNAGGTGTLTLRAHGTNERLLVEIRNYSPNVVQLSKGDPERVTTSGGENNTAPVDVKFLSAGSYVVVAKLIAAESAQALPNVDSARKRLVEARGIASGVWTVRIDRLLLKIDSEPLDLAQIRAELKNLLDERPGASLAALLNSAWLELQSNR